MNFRGWRAPSMPPHFFLLVALLTSISLVGCHNSSNGGGGTQPTQQPPSTPPIGSSGGTATSTDGKASVIIPAGALSQDTQITVTPAASPPAGNVGTAYNFGPNGTMFAQPVTIEITYDPSSLPSDVTDADLVLAKAISGQWSPITGSGVLGMTAGVVTGTTTSFSVFGLIPVTPSNVQAVPADSQVTLTWDPVDLADSYNVYWTSSAGGSGTERGALSPFVHLGLTNGVTYSYRISAQKQFGEGGLSAPPVDATPVAPPGPPGAPTNLRGCPANQEIQLTWDPVTGATFYTVQWDETINSMPDGSNIGTGFTVPEFTHTGRVNGNTYEYFVRAENAAGASPSSAPEVVTITTLDPPTNFMANAGVGSVSLSWNAVPCATAYRIDWSGGGLNDSIDILDPTVVEYTHTGLGNGVTYDYTIVSINALGAGPASPQASATPQAGATPIQISASASVASTCVVYSDGGLKCLGGNPGDGTSFASTPVNVTGIVNATHVSVGLNHTCVVDDGQVKCWGSNTSGQFGNGTTTLSLSPVAATGVSTATSVAVGNTFTCAIVSGAAECWGAGPGVGTMVVDPMTGMGTWTDTLIPVQVTLPGSPTRLSAAKGRSMACAVLTNSETWCWGNMLSGSYADPMDPGCYLNVCAPVLSTLGPAMAFAELGQSHACHIPILFILGVICIGGAQGDSFETPGFDTPLILNVLAAGNDFNCGIEPGGNAVCWGWNGEYQLGNGTNTIEPFSTAVNVIGVNNATAISAGYTHACAIDDGVVKCWGQLQGGVPPFTVPGF